MSREFFFFFKPSPDHLCVGHIVEAPEINKKEFQCFNKKK